MTKPVESVVVVGGGTAGWITACRVAAEHKANPSISVTLIEAPDIQNVGVGEGTWPTMRNTLEKIGVSETDFLKECNASFKQGAKFARWVDGSNDDYYYHPLVLPQGFPEVDLTPYWLKQTDGASPTRQNSYSNSVCFQEQLCERGLAPKLITTAEYSSIANYAYHLDAGKFTDFLTKHGVTKLGINHVRDEVIGVNAAANGDISSVKLKESGDLSGDLFVDCTGFRSLLLGDHLGVPFIDKNDVLFVDNAIAMQVPYADENTPIVSHTISTAQQAGWIWDIGLYTRRGTGYVYSSAHMSEDQAMQTLRDYIGPDFDKLTAKKIPINSGHREIFWKNNCVAVGLSAGFLEPLEASALVLVEMSAEMISEQLPACRDVMDITAKRYNKTFRYRWDRIIDFLKLHYILSKRTDNQFWIDNRDPKSIPDSLAELMELWRYQLPGDKDFDSKFEVFPAASYLYVLYGMGFKTEQTYLEHTMKHEAQAEAEFMKNKQSTARALSALPSNRVLLDKVRQYGFQRI